MIYELIDLKRNHRLTQNGINNIVYNKIGPPGKRCFCLLSDTGSNIVIFVTKIYFNLNGLVSKKLYRGMMKRVKDKLVLSHGAEGKY